jgi:hypothetical protein
MTDYTMRETEWWCEICGGSGSVLHRSTAPHAVVHKRAYMAHAHSEECAPECDDGCGLNIGPMPGDAPKGQ